MKVVYTDISIDQTEIIKSYLLYKFTQREVERFYKLLEKFDRRVVIFPEMYPVSVGNPGVRHAVLSKQLSVFYRTSQFTITVLAILDNRMDPKKWP